MAGAGPHRKAKGIVLVTAVLLLIMIRGNFWARQACLSLDILHADGGLRTQCNGFPGELAAADYQSLKVLRWVQGKNEWLAGKPEQALAQWQQAPEYAAAMLLNWVKVSPIQDAVAENELLVQALNLDPYTTTVSETASFRLFEDEAWELAKEAFTAVYQANPGNAVAKAALALAIWQSGGPHNKALQLYDEAVTAAPDNLYVLRYGLRLMQIGPEFGEKRMSHLANLAAARLPQDFEFTFGVANAYRALGDLETAVHYNLMALDVNPAHPWANLQQLELAQQLRQTQNLHIWQQQAIDNRVKDRPDYYRRLLAVLVEEEAYDKAEEMYCDGRAQGIPAAALLRFLDEDNRARLEHVACKSITSQKIIHKLARALNT